MNNEKREKDLIPAGRLSRRQFVQAAGIGVAVFALPACFGDGVRRIGIGELDDGGDSQDLSDNQQQQGNGDMSMRQQQGGNPDLRSSQGGPVDMAQSQQGGNPDMAQVQSSCPQGVYNTKMAASSFAMGTATYISAQDLFICRDGSGLFAVSSICTHQGCTMTWKSAGHFYCPCHGAEFTQNGDIITGPVYQPLDHYPLCIANGTVAVDPNHTTNKTTRLNA